MAFESAAFLLSRLRSNQKRQPWACLAISERGSVGPAWQCIKLRGGANGILFGLFVSIGKLGERKGFSTYCKKLNKIRSFRSAPKVVCTSRVSRSRQDLRERPLQNNAG